MPYVSSCYDMCNSNGGFCAVFQAYGMSVLPLNLIKGTRSVAYERLENTEDIDDVEHQIEKLKSKVGFGKWHKAAAGYVTPSPRAYFLPVAKLTSRNDSMKACETHEKTRFNISIDLV